MTNGENPMKLEANTQFFDAKNPLAVSIRPAKQGNYKWQWN